MFRVHKVFLATAYPKGELVETMNRFFACLALCASLSASAQDDNCTVLGIQDLTQMVFEFQGQLNAQDATIDSLQNAAMTRDSVRAIARGEAAIGGSMGIADLSGAYLSYANLPYANLDGANLSGANLTDAVMNCLLGCPNDLPSGYICEADPDCSTRYRIVPE